MLTFRICIAMAISAGLTGTGGAMSGIRIIAFSLSAILFLYSAAPNGAAEFYLDFSFATQSLAV